MARTKRLGLIGCRTANSPVVYWQVIHDQARRSLGDSGPADLLVHISDAARLRGALRTNDWATIQECLFSAGHSLRLAGADALVICGSAFNPIVPDLQRSIELPVVDLGQAMLFRTQEHRFRKMGLLGVHTARESAMWGAQLPHVALLEPSESERKWLLGVDPQTASANESLACKIECQRLVSGMRRRGAQALILADHGFAHWVKPDETVLPLFDAEEIHAWTAALWAMEDAMRPSLPCIVA